VRWGSEAGASARLRGQIAGASPSSRHRARLRAGESRTVGVLQGAVPFVAVSCAGSRSTSPPISSARRAMARDESWAPCGRRDLAVDMDRRSPRRRHRRHGSHPGPAEAHARGAASRTAPSACPRQDRSSGDESPSTTSGYIPNVSCRLRLDYDGSTQLPYARRSTALTPLGRLTGCNGRAAASATWGSPCTGENMSNRCRACDGRRGAAGRLRRGVTGVEQSGVEKK